MRPSLIQKVFDSLEASYKAETLDVEDLRMLHSMLGNKIKSSTSFKLADFKKGDSVRLLVKNEAIEGYVDSRPRVNSKTVRIDTPQGYWRVSPLSLFNITAYENYLAFGDEQPEKVNTDSISKVDEPIEDNSDSGTW